jgi:hypothetical protein
MQRHRSLRFLAPLTLLLLALAGSAFAQTDVTSIRISGTVKDADGQPLPGVMVQGTNLETGHGLTAVTDDKGFYRLLNLPTGRYKLEAKLEGFIPQSTELKTVIGTAPTVNFTLRLGGTETVEVTGLPVVEATQTAAATTIETEQLRMLPTNGRNFTDMVLLTPESRRDSERGNLSLSGQRGINTNVMVDGVDYNNAFFGGTAGTAEGRAPLSISSESVKEFSVITNGASVEFGRSAGGFVNVITKSGTNELHGSAFYYTQPKDLVAENADGKELDQKKQQYGASVGGPILRDRLFYFASYDQQAQDETITLDPDFLSRSAPAFQVFPVLATDDSFVKTTDAKVYFGRMDFQATDTQRMLVRVNRAEYDGDNATSSSPVSTSGRNGVEMMTSTTAVATWSGNFGGSFFNDLNLQYVKEDTPREDKAPNLTEVQLGTYRYGGVGFLPIVSTTKRKEIGDTLTWAADRHLVKGGFDWNDTSIAQIFKGNWRGVYRFAVGDPSKGQNYTYNLEHGFWNQYYQFGGLNGLTADEAGAVSFHQKELALFLQDQWFVTPSLTVTAGVRWEKLDNPNDPILNPEHENADHSWAVDGKIPDADSQWSPRMAVAWSAPDAKTVARASAGRFWSRTPALLFAQLYSSNGVRGTQYTINAGGGGPTDPLAPGWGVNFDPEGVAPIDFSAITRIAKPGVFVMPEDFENPRTDRFTVEVEREIFAGTSASLGYTYAKTEHLERMTDLNLQYLRNADGSIVTSLVNGMPVYDSVRPNPYYARVSGYVSDAESLYRAITGTVQRRFTDGLAALVSVTYAKDKDNDSNERNFGAFTAEDVHDLGGSWGYSNRDQRWKVIAASSYETPWWGIGVSGMFKYYSGQPYNAILSTDVNKDGFTNDRPTVDGNHFDRNAYRNPQVRTLDLRLSKAFEIGPGDLQLFAECFNCANWENRSVGVTSVYGDQAAPLGNFGRDGGYSTSPRTFQIAARYDF